MRLTSVVFKKMKKFLLLFIVITQTNCFKEIDIDIPEINPLPVANTIFQPDSVFKVTLSKTRKILSNNPVTDIDNAFIRLSHDNTLIDTLTFQNGGYVSDIRPIIGEDYNITIDIEGFETLQANDKIPEAPNLISASFKDSVYTDSEGYFLSQAEIVFLDNPNEKNYYELILKQSFDDPELLNLFGETSETYISEVLFDYESNDIVLENEGQLALFAFTNPVFSDELFNGKAYEMRVNYGGYYTFENVSYDSDLIVVLRSVSKDYYTYKKSLTAHIETQFSDVWDGVVEPAQMFTNIKGGYGIFAGFSQVTDTIVK